MSLSLERRFNKQLDNLWLDCSYKNGKLNKRKPQCVTSAIRQKFYEGKTFKDRANLKKKRKIIYIT